MNTEEIIRLAEGFVRERLGADTSGHDWFHIERVRRMAVRLARHYQADAFLCELAALLHDLADGKLQASESEALAGIAEWLSCQGVDQAAAAHALRIIGTMSFKGGQGSPMPSLEGQIVQDADRLDALGAIGIARTFMYSGWKGQMMHDPELPPRDKMTLDEYLNGRGTAINHFHEKLFKLKDLMNTDAARQIAEERHRFMELFLQQFMKEWSGGDV
ncbi:HD domain-containing protein [Ferviditalea candida]|uniref:HD domain-containing protein n=1 Tax=Ferviditalea candida TaxID=3108399 RepID=A0ABU5ZKV2_9BACL|nr:HD domain-containing protein [Paenibacillaceae bacterium T2]